MNLNKQITLHLSIVFFFLTSTANAILSDIKVNYKLIIEGKEKISPQWRGSVTQKEDLLQLQFSPPNNFAILSSKTKGKVKTILLKDSITDSEVQIYQNKKRIKKAKLFIYLKVQKAQVLISQSCKHLTEINEKQFLKPQKIQMLYCSHSKQGIKVTAKDYFTQKITKVTYIENELNKNFFHNSIHLSWSYRSQSLDSDNSFLGSQLNFNNTIENIQLLSIFKTDFISDDGNLFSQSYSSFENSLFFNENSFFVTNLRFIPFIEARYFHLVRQHFSNEEAIELSPGLLLMSPHFTFQLSSKLISSENHNRSYHFHLQTNWNDFIWSLNYRHQKFKAKSSRSDKARRLGVQIGKYF